MSTLDHKFELHVDGAALPATLVSPATELPGVLFLHGWGASQQVYLARARSIAAAGCIALTFDLRVHSHRHESPDVTVSRDESLREVLAAYDRLVEQPNVDRSAIAVVGTSYGGYLGAILTTYRPVKWLGLRVPAIYKDEGWDLPKRELHRGGELQAFRHTSLEPAQNRALSACAQFKGDALVVESEHDTIIPHPTIMNYVQALKNTHSLTYRVIEGADHALSNEAHQRAYTSILVNWLKEMVVGQTHEKRT